MKLYSCVIEYRNCVRLYQFLSENIDEAIIKLINIMNIPYIKGKRKAMLLSELEKPEIGIARLKGMWNVWCLFALVWGDSFLVNVVESDILISKKNKEIVNYQFTVIVLFKEGTFVQQIIANDLRDCLVKWSRYLSWRYYNKEERKTIRTMVSNSLNTSFNSQNMIQFHEKIEGNWLRLYVIKSPSQVESE